MPSSDNGLRFSAVLRRYQPGQIVFRGEVYFIEWGDDLEVTVNCITK